MGDEVRRRRGLCHEQVLGEVNAAGAGGRQE
jgi:hypothetical protein